ncbi:MAG: hypothetical protein K8T89_10025 [Planctomycetes bacterium]|nr:hypothetical protein [Planctomycetota bacterium]
MTVRRIRSWPLSGLCLIILMGFLPASAHSQSFATPTLSIDVLETRATEFEKNGKWNDALQVWCKIYGVDRQHQEANKHIQICLRRIFQGQRQVDQSLREKVLSLSHSQALALYSEVLTTLHSAYVDKVKVMPSRLFQQGAEEFLLVLSDPNFRKQHMPDVRDKEIRDFQNRMREFLAVQTIDTIPAALLLVKQIAATAKRDLRIQRTCVVVLEFIGGACNSLDEYTTYLSPAELASEARAEMEASVVSTGFLKEGVGYFKITHFRDTTPEEVDSAIAALKMAPQGLKVLIMDLRGNPGGLFSAAVQVVERFIPEGVIVSTQGRLDEFNKIHQSAARMNVIEIPLVVLVDGVTASAAEVLAGAFRDHQRATLVGASTYGKGSIQRILQFQTAEELDEMGKPKPRTGGIRITLARFYSPNGQAINGAGVNPHLVEQDKVRQLEVALEQASRFVSVPPPR